MGVVDVVDGAVRWYARSALGVEYGDGVAVLVKSYTYLLGAWSCFAITDDPADDRLYEVTRDASGGVRVRHYDAAPDRVYEPEEGKTSERKKVGVMSDDIPGYLMRMVGEYRELVGRKTRLADYRALHFRELEESGEEELMSDQEYAIREYADVLMKRLRFHLGDRAAEIVADGHRES
ncbi:hypothetical protein PSRA_1707 [Pseudoscardovia radai]|uniref:Uncharacterized protein n=1 Tax=Pseudoscardovia radai TaxID=987066 RepID=A0A261EQ92_9BIFI|nr:hypothetical protein [Pseudoscardovia radai]OZG49022.1 hypothetical protein PSRA_1707 [Pseudoscardovia radai]